MQSLLSANVHDTPAPTHASDNAGGGYVDSARQPHRANLRHANLLGMAVAFSIIFFGLVEFGVHQLVATFELQSDAVAVMDAVVMGVSIGLAVWLLLVGNCERRTRVREDLECIAELNHEVRDALQVIAHSHFDADSAHREMVMDSVARIDAVLKGVFPVVGAGARSAKTSARIALCLLDLACFNKGPVGATPSQGRTSAIRTLVLWVFDFGGRALAI